MFFRRLKYPLPKVPGNVRSTFRNMCGDISAEDVAEFERQIEISLNGVRDEGAEQPRVNVKLAEEIASRCRLLLEHFEEFSPYEKKLVAGAVRYFLCPEDPLSDEHFATGFDDDAAVVNHVLEQLGIEGMYIELD